MTTPPRRDVPLSLADIDPDDDELVDAWNERQLEEGYARVLETMRDMQARGIIDEHGNRIRKELPEAMLDADKDSDVV